MAKRVRWTGNAADLPKDTSERHVRYVGMGTGGNTYQPYAKTENNTARTVTVENTLPDSDRRDRREKFDAGQYAGDAGKLFLNGVAEGLAATGASVENLIGKGLDKLFPGAGFEGSGLFNVLYNGRPDWKWAGENGLVGIKQDREYNQESLQQNADKVNNKVLKKAAEFGGDIAYGLGNAAPMAAEAMATGGASVAANLTKEGLLKTGAEVVEKTGVLNTLSKATRDMLTSKDYWTSFASEVGMDYYDAKDNGATEDEALRYALYSAGLNSVIEIGGGIQKIPERPTFKTWLKSAHEEGMEEVQQGIVSRLLENAVYNKGNPIVSVKDDSAVINPVTAVGEYAGGAVVGGILSGGEHLTQRAINRAARAERNKQAKKVYGDTAQDLVAESLELNPNNELATRLQNKLDNGEELTGNELRQLVEQNEDNMVTSDKASIQSAVEGRLSELGATKNVSKMAEIITQQISGENVADSDRQLVENSKVGRQVSQELNPENIRVGAANEAWTGKIGTARINTTAYNRDMQKTGVTGAKYNAETGKLDAIVTNEAGEVKTVPAAEAEMTPMQEELFDWADELKLEAAGPLMVRAYQPEQNMELYTRSFKLAYEYGKAGMPMDYVEKSEGVNYLHPTQIKLAYEEGQAATQRKVQAREEKIRSGGTTDSTTKKKGSVSLRGAKVGSKTYAPVNRKTVDSRQWASVKAMRAFSRAVGVDVVFYQSQANERGVYEGANGFYKGGKLYLDINAGRDTVGMTETAILKTAAHELTHFIQANSAQYEALKSFVVNKLAHEEGVSFEDLVADKQRREPGLEYNEAVDEVVADACEMMLGDSTVVEQLTKENRSLAEKIRDWLREWVENLKIALEGLQADRTESRAMMQYARELQEIWDNALMDAARNNRGAAREAAPAESRQQVRIGTSESIKPGEKPLKGMRDDDKMGAVNASLKEDLENGKARKEDRGAFLRRAVEEGYQVFEGKSAAYGYRSVRWEYARENARQIQKELTELGIDAEIVDGDILWNLDGISSARRVPQATAVEKERILINTAASLAPRNIAGHEAFHLWYGLSARRAFEDVVTDNLNFSSKEFIGYQSAISEAYLGDEADLSDETQYTKLMEEIIAYISGDIHEGVNDDLLRPMFRDYDAVKAAWVKLCKDRTGGEVRFSVRESFSKEIDSWAKDGMPEGVRFTLGSTGPVLQGLGAIESDIYMEGDKIQKILQDHPEMTLAEIKKVPQILEDPALILKSEGRGKSGANSRLVCFGLTKAQNGQPVMTVMDLRPRENGFVVDDMQKVNSAYTKKNPMAFIQKSDVVYADKKRAIPLLRTTGLTISSQQLLRNGYIGSISYKGSSVNIEGVPFSSVVKMEANDKVQNSMRDSVGRELTEAQQAYFKDSKVRDADGNLLVMYHQTDGTFTVFDTKHKGAGAGDDETPFGIFLKRTPRNIGVRGEKQMELYADIRNPLRVRDRTELVSKLRELSVNYARLKDESAQIDKEYGAKFEEAKNAFKSFLIQWRKNNPDAPRRAAYDADGFDAAFNAEDNVVKEWTRAKDELALRAKTSITQALRDNGYDGVILENDKGSWGRSTDAYIALDANQVKNTTNKTPTADPDIRYSVRENLPNEIDSWAKDGMPEGVRFTLGSTGPVLQGLGAIESDIYMDGDKIQKILQDHPEMTLAEIKKVPQILEDPAMVLKSKTRTNSLVVLGTYRAQNGRPILAAMDLLPMENGVFVYGMQKLSSAYTKTGEVKSTGADKGAAFLRNSDVLFLDKKRATLILRPMGIQTPTSFLQSGYIGSISYKGSSVNIQGRPFSSVVKIEADNKTQSQQRDPRLSDRDVLRMAADMAKRDRSQRWSVEDLNRFDLLRRKLVQLDEANAELEALKEERKVLLAGRKVKELTRDEQFDLAQNRNRTETQKGKIQRLEEETYKIESVPQVKALLRKSRSIVEADAAYKARSRYREQRYEGQRKAVERRKVERVAKKLITDLNTNNDKKHIPEPLKRPIGELLESLDFISGDARANKKIHRRDLEYGATLRRMKDALDTYRKNEANGTDEGADGYIDLPEGLLELMSSEAKRFEDAAARFTPGTNVIASMSREELSNLHVILSSVREGIVNIDKMFQNEQFERVKFIGEETMRYLTGKEGDAGAIKQMAMWDNTLPWYAFQRFGQGGRSIFEELMDGQDKFAYNANRILKFRKALIKDKTVRAWDKEIHELELTTHEGERVKVTMTTTQLMNLYLLSRRKHGLNHILGGGIRLKKTVEPTLVNTVREKVSKDKKKLNQEKTSEHFKLKDAEVGQLLKLLTPEQIEVARALQKFAAEVGGAWGNEITMRRFGFRGFTEENYWTIEVDKQDLSVEPGDKKDGSLYRLQNISAVKPLTEEAKGAVVIRGVFDVFSDHMTDMAKYNAFVLPIIDAQRWLNYKTAHENNEGHVNNRSVQRAMTKVYGAAANNYVIEFLRDLNGVKESGDRGDTLTKRMISKAKRVKVALNFNVAAQQPTSYMRASAVLEHKYLAKAFAAQERDTMKDKLILEQDRKELLEYSGIALWKEMGFFDTDIGHSLREQIKGGQSLSDKIADKTMLGAEWGDKLTWARLWRACKLEVQDKQHLTGEELLKAAAKRFREVIYRTQVVDSTLTRSHNMRSNSTFAKFSTAFMSEPTVSYNVAMYATENMVRETAKLGLKVAVKRNWHQVIRQYQAVLASSVAAALVNAINAALRDPDDDPFFEKVWKEFFGEKSDSKLENAVNIILGLDGTMLGEINPLSKLPELKSVVNTLSGFGSGRMDMDVITNAQRAVQIWDEYIRLQSGDLDEPTKTTYYGNMTPYGRIYPTLKALSDFSGLPISNLSREATTLFNTGCWAFGVEENKVRTYQSKQLKEAWENYGKASGVSYAVMYRATQDTKDFESDKDADGNTISGSLKAKYVDYIKGLGLNRAQGKAVWEAAKVSSWSDKDTPWG